MRKLILILLAVFPWLPGCLAGRPTGPEFTVLAMQVRTPDGKPVPGVRVELLAEGKTEPGSYVTGNRGDSTIIGITPGVYHVGVRHPPTGYRVPSTQPNPVRVVVVPEKETTVRFTLVRE
ncbi:MAG TPA: carboxypeptidase-like regulatory domain-containing protein [Longimicrobiaceae bacterium]|nr:carboxypeptidase-like regulatory domain-containing protein [Longimicrobiaceae bacterium]